MPATPPPLDPPLVFEVREKTTPRYTGTITDDDGAAIPAASLTTLTLTLYVIQTDGTIAYVNSRNAQNVLNTNNVTVSSAGVVVWSVQVADTTFVESLPFERHIALWEWTWSAGAKAGKHEVILNVQKIQEA